MPFRKVGGAGDIEELSRRFRLRGGGETGGPLRSGEGARGGGGRFLLAATCTNTFCLATERR